MSTGSPRRRAAAVKIGVGLALLLVVLALPAPPVRAEIVNKILATVDGDPITLYELKKFVRHDVRGRQLLASNQAALLEAVIMEHLIDKEVSAQGLVIRDADVQHYIDGIKERNKLSDEQLRNALEQQGLSWDEYLTQVRRELQKVQLINHEIRGKVSVTPEEVERYYKANLEQYSTAEEIEVSHIVLLLPAGAEAEQVDETMARAADIHAQLENGAGFEELAKRYSEDASAAGGGSLGGFKKGEMLDEFEEQVTKLKPGQYSRPFRTRVGVHIVRLDRAVGATRQSLDDLAADIRERLYNEALEERYNRWLRDDLRRRHAVEIRP
jgi:peptidyl-prolyl cis-trans isomerase SurA